MNTTRSLGLISLGLVFLLGLNSTATAQHPRQCNRASLVHFDGTIVEAAIATPELSILVDAVVAAGLADALSAPGRLTVFAPTNDAFSKIPAPILNALLDDPAGLLTSVLTYHVAPRLVDLRWVYYPRERSTLQGQTVFLNRSRQGPQVNQSNVQCQGVRTSNGIVWIIDSILQPQF